MKQELISEKKLFSEKSKNPHILAAIKQGSPNPRVAEMRYKTYSKLFASYHEMKKDHFESGNRVFSDYTQSNLLGNQYFNATLMGLAKSMAGFLSIERNMDQPKALLWFYDLLNVATQQNVLPNLGAENIGAYANNLSVTQALANAVPVDILFGQQLIPKTVSIIMTITVAGTPTIYNVSDDGNGNLLSVPGLLSAGNVNYNTGQVSFTVALTTNPATDTASVKATDNQTAAQGANRFETDWKTIFVDTYPETLTGETNLVSMAAQRKALGVEAQDVTVSKLTELYTKMVNIKLINQIIQNDLGNPVVINMAGNQFLDYRSRLDQFVAQLSDVDTALAIKSVKGVKATAYVCGTTVVSIFRKLRQYGLFIDAPQSYINDLVGYFNGIPVLEHINIPATSGYAIHKTADGQLAPTIRGIFLPLTNTPAIGNYQNVTQIATGVFYQEQNLSITSLLQQAFNVINYVG